MSPGTLPRASADLRHEKSTRARQPCAHCEAEKQTLYILPGRYRHADGRFDVCPFCYLKITGSRPDPLFLLD